MPYEDRLPVTLLTGFLGSGKTTLLNSWLRSPELADAAVIVHEFGEIGIDHALIEWARDIAAELRDEDGPWQDEADRLLAEGDTVAAA